VDIINSSGGPPAPTGLTATVQNNSVFLSWNASTGAQYYNVYRGTAPGGEQGQPIASPTGTTYTDATVVDGNTYYYTVAAVSSAGTSAPSNEASATLGLSTLQNGLYTVTNSAASLVWDDPAFSSSQGTNVILWPTNGGTNQKWVFNAIGNGYYTIMNDFNGLLLDDPAFSTTSGTKLIQYSSNGGNNQHWLVVQSGNGFIIKNQYSGLVVDPSTNSQNTAIVEATANGSSTQNWVIH
jgi:hypothetical protein